MDVWVVTDAQNLTGDSSVKVFATEHEARVEFDMHIDALLESIDQIEVIAFDGDEYGEYASDSINAFPARLRACRGVIRDVWVDYGDTQSTISMTKHTLGVQGRNL